MRKQNCKPFVTIEIHVIKGENDGYCFSINSNYACFIYLAKMLKTQCPPVEELAPKWPMFSLFWIKPLPPSDVSCSGKRANYSYIIWDRPCYQASWSFRDILLILKVDEYLWKCVYLLESVSSSWFIPIPWL